MKSNSFPSLTHLSVEYIPEWLLDTSAVSQFFYSALPSTGTSGAWRGVHCVSTCTDTARPYIPRAWGGRTGILINPPTLASESKALTLSGYANDTLLDPDSISLPLLEKLVCKASEGNVLIQAIVVPNLIHLEYRPHAWANLAGNLFNLHTPRYPKATRLVLKQGIGCPNEVASFQFPAVRHITLRDYGIGILCGSKKGTNYCCLLAGT